ncbi:MAG: hypothetical protein IJT87_12520 [Ruminiclostridium sp.]|nr:hypothetical protein [Ruminiclostridium sp.]
MKIRKTIAVLLTAIIVVSGVFSVPAGAARALGNLYVNRATLLTDMLLKDTETLEAVKTMGRAVVFFSVSDGKTRAKVFQTQAKDIGTAVNTAYSKMRKSGVTPKWMKLDVAVSVNEVLYSDFVTKYTESREDCMRDSIAFNSYCGTALLEAQINSLGMLDYTTGRLDLGKVNAELSRMGKKKLEKIPDKLYLLRTQGYFADNNAYAYKLINGTYGDVGRRDVTLDRKGLETLAQTSSSYLSSLCDENGKFVYGYYPIDNEEIEGYNIVRHCGTVWNMVMQYEMCRDETLLPVIERAFSYLAGYTYYKDNSTAFVLDNSTYNLGGNGLALIAYCTYAEVTGSAKYNKTITALANGILFMQKYNGAFVHAINRYTYQTVYDYITIFYDGEAAYGLGKAYGVTNNEKYLTAARRACNYFISQGIVTEHSHWMAYAFNELTKYTNDVNYYAFALKNIDGDDYSLRVHNTPSSMQAAAETLNAAFETYARLTDKGITCEGSDTFHAKRLVDAVIKRANYGLNYFMYPEYAMYFEAPETVVNSFAVREDKFRIRIDDIQHFMDGYYMYWKNYDTIMQYRDMLQENEAKERSSKNIRKTEEDN